MSETLTFANGMTVTVTKPDYPGTRVDVWARCFDGAYRLSLAGKHGRELEQLIGPLGQAWARVRAPMNEGGASLAECLETVRLALIGGGMAVVDGEERRIGPSEAAVLIDCHLTDAPLDDARRIAAAALEAVIMGRKATPEERDAAIASARAPSEYPVLVPAWARAEAQA